MAVLLPQCSSLSFSRLERSHVFVNGGKTRLPCNAKRSHSIRCESSDEVVVPASSTIAPAEYPAIKRSDFPTDFMFGASTSAVQSEGPADIGGRGPSTWDFILTQGSYSSAAFSYLYYKDDVQLLKKMGMDVYRFSISWSRVLPNGKGDINLEGIQFYNNLIDELLANGIQPFVTLFHLDLPVALANEYNGFLDKRIVEDYKNYCDICFKNFGDRVKYWGTINEPDIYAQYGYLRGLVGEDDPARYPYIVAQNLILAHATVVRHYKSNYLDTQGGLMGMTVSLIWFEPYSPELKQDREAANRAFAFHTELFVEPFVYGDYPFIVKSLVRDRLPEFTAEDKELIKGAYDFVGINYYTSRYARFVPVNPNGLVNFDNDQYLEAVGDRDGKPLGENIAENIYMAPDGLRDGLINLKESYNNPAIYITENGVVDLAREDRLITDDGHRITFVSNHLKAVQEALKKDVNVKAYMVWSMIDVVELGGGYDVKLGLNYTNYDTFERTPKKSAKWFSQFLKKHIEANAN